jgi:hypothetical protein
MPASYRDLGPTRPLVATPDQTFRNTGNWTIVADPQVLNCHVGQAEISQIGLDGPVGGTVSVYRNQQLWNAVVQGWSNNYDPTNPLYIRPGDTVFLFWKVPVSWPGPTPTATIWMRYDIELPENRNAQ